MRIDLHIHTRNSLCSNLHPELILKQAKFMSLDGIAIADHNTLAGYRELKRIKSDLTIIPGIEVRTKICDLIGLFVENEIKEGLSLNETADKIREQGGLVIIPHPFDLKRNNSKLREEDIKSIRPDAIEVFNSRTSSHFINKKAKEFAEREKITSVAGSDAHFMDEIGLAGIITKNDNVFKCIKNGDLKIFGEYGPSDSHFRSKLELLRKKLLIS